MNHASPVHPASLGSHLPSVTSLRVLVSSLSLLTKLTKINSDKICFAYILHSFVKKPSSLLVTHRPSRTSSTVILSVRPTERRTRLHISLSLLLGYHLLPLLVFFAKEQKTHQALPYTRNLHISAVYVLHHRTITGST